jgi:hypothetical protein
LFYLEAAFKNYPDKHVYVDIGYFEKLKLWQVYALLKTDAIEQPDELLSGIKPAEFYFLSKKYATILYLLLTIEFKRKDHKAIQQLESLINETGFIRFSGFY